jgi:hypothetical protein
MVKLSTSIENDDDYKLYEGNIKIVDLMDAGAWMKDIGAKVVIKYCVSFFTPSSNPHAFNTTDAEKYKCYFWEFQNIKKINTCHGEKDCFVIDKFPEFLFVNDHSDVTLKRWNKLPNQSGNNFKKMNSEFTRIKHDHWALITVGKMNLLDFGKKLDLLIQTFNPCSSQLKAAGEYDFLPDFEDWDDEQVPSLKYALKFASTTKCINPNLLWKVSAVFTALELQKFDEVMCDPFLALALFRFLRLLARHPDCKINQKIERTLDYLYGKYQLEIDDDISDNDGKSY